MFVEGSSFLLNFLIKCAVTNKSIKITALKKESKFIIVLTNLARFFQKMDSI